MPLSPESVALLKATKKAMPMALSEMPVETARTLMRRTAIPPTTEIFERIDVEVPTRASWVTVRVYRPSAAVDLPMLMYLHGGGFALGDLDMHDEYLRNLAKAAGVPGDMSRLGVGGDSAGGSLSFALALRVRDEGLGVPGS